MPRKKLSPPPTQNAVDDINFNTPSDLPTPLAPRRAPRKKRVKPAVPPPVKESEAIDRFEVSDEKSRGSLAPSPRFYRTIALSFLGITILLVIFVIFFTSGKAVISLTLKSQTVKVDANVKVADKADSRQLAGLVVAKTISGEKTFSPSGGVASPASATGKVTIYNKTKRSQPLVSTTRLLSPNNILFRLKKSVLVPTGGQIEADVYADKPGLTGEIGPTKFTIPGLSEILRKDIYAESKTAMTGGTKRLAAITQNDIKTAEDSLALEMYQRGQTELSNQIKTTSTLLTASVFTYLKDSFKTKAETGVVADHFTMEGSVKVIGIFYNPLDLNNFLISEARLQLSEGQEIGQPVSSPRVEFNQYNLTAKTADLKVKQEFLTEINYSKDLLDRAKLLGELKSSATDYLLGLPWIDKVEIKTRPAWSKKLPSEANKVEIKVSE